MIYRISCDLPKFKTLDFSDGFNILFSEKSTEATDLHTRNRAGKSSMIELVHFLLGSDLKKDSIFRADELKDSTFEMEFTLAGRTIRVSRSAAAANKILVEGNFTNWEISPKFDRKAGAYFLTNKEWKRVLGQQVFHLTTSGTTNEDIDSSESDESNGSFRSVFPYFARQQRNGGFIEPERHSEKQQVSNHQVALSFLFDFDVTLPQQWNVLREQEKSLKELRRAAKSGSLGKVIGTVGELRTQLAVASDKAKKYKKNLENFKVLERYVEFEEEASTLTRKITDAANKNTVDQEYLKSLYASVNDVAPLILEDIEALYKDAGIIFPSLVTKRFEEVEAFHKSILENRKSYLQLDIKETIQIIEQRRSNIQLWEKRRAELMEILKTHGALHHFYKLQEEQTRLDAEVEILTQRYQAAERLEADKAQNTIDKNILFERLKQNYIEQKEWLESIIIIFETYSKSLYESAGSLHIYAKDTGPKFEVNIPGQRSKGISNMQIFCFDLTLMEVCAKRGIGPGFLIHDSHIFDGVDERQIAKALALGAETAKRVGFQYIVTMNSDALPKEGYPPGFDIQQYILPVRLTDAREDGGLFGLRFG